MAVASYAYTIMQCACGVVVFHDREERKYRWPGMEPHDCADDMLHTLQLLTAEALDGEDLSARLVPEAVEAWLAL